MELKLLKGMGRSSGFMRKIFVFCLILFFTISYSQIDNAYKYMQNANGVPKGNNSNNSNSSSVNLCTGRLSTNMPLHEFVGREINLPISLGYTTNGVKVNELAGSVGLGWSLNIGGSINRVVGGRADDYYGGVAGCSATDVEWEDEDLYIMNAIGISDCFQFEISHAIPSPKVNPLICPRYDDATKVWTVTLEDGTKFYFGENNTIEISNTLNGSPRLGCPAENIISKTSWLLTKIVSKNNMDEYRFVYQNFDWLNYLPNNGEGFRSPFINSYGYSEYGYTQTTSSYKTNQQMIKEVYHNNEKIIGFNYDARQDMQFTGGTTIGNKLTEIECYNFKNLNSYKKIVFAYSYFGNSSSTNFLDKRLKLDEITFKGFDTSNLNGFSGNNYKFDYYHPSQVPPITSYARDYLGLYNGKDTNPHLIPIESGFPYSSGTSSRDYNFDKSITGLLKRIDYTNKGFDLIEYEQNALIGDYSNVFVPQQTVGGSILPAHYDILDTKSDFKDGFRTKSVTSYASVGLISNKTEYKYSGGLLQDFVPRTSDYFKKSSVGYHNAPNIITYNIGKIVNIDNQGQNNGYVENRFFNNFLNGPLGAQLPAIANNGIIFSATVREDENVELTFSSKLPENIVGVNIYDKNNNLMSSETNDYCTYLLPTLQLNIPRFFSKQCANSKENFYGSNIIKSSIDFNYGEFDINMNSPLLNSKTINHNNGKYENYVYQYTTNPLNYLQRFLSGTTVSNESGQILADNKSIFSTKGTRYLLTETQSAIGTNTLETNAKYDYDTDGNMIEMVNVTPGTIANNQYKSYIYGYNNRFVVAKITGARYSDIPAANITAIKNASNQMINEANNLAMENALNALRSVPALADAQITTTTINPVFGPTSVTDPKGYTIYMEYDVLGRQTLSKEKNHASGFNILSETKFNIRPN